jgi:quinol monooxygenase YgiN
MIIEYIRYEASDADALLRAYERARSSLDASPHCLAFEMTRCAEAPSTFVIRIEWESSEGHLKGFRKSPEFTAFFEAVRPFMPEILEMRHYELTNVVARKRFEASSK